MSQEFAVADLIEALSEGLYEASSRLSKTGRDPVVELTECDIELSVSATYKGSGGVKFYILNTSVGSDTSSASKIRLKFRPIEGAKARQFYQEGDDDAPRPPEKQR